MASKVIKNDLPTDSIIKSKRNLNSSLQNLDIEEIEITVLPRRNDTFGMRTLRRRRA